MNQWQKIETAPKDGSYCLVWVVYPWHGGRHEIACWDGQGWDNGDGPPTHWMPLPEAPTDE